MIPRPLRCLILALVFMIGPMARAGDHASVVVEATKLLEEISSKPDSGIPSRYLREAKGVLIMPHMTENLIGIGRKKGRGVFLTRGKNGEWETPESVKVWGLSMGPQAGRMVTDMIVIYRTEEAADQHGKFLIGLTAGGSIGRKPRDRFTHSRFDADAEDSVLVYTRGQGILFGARIVVEITTDSSPSRVKSKTRPDAGKTDAVAGPAVKVAKADAAVSQAKAKPVSVSPEVARLKSTLTAMTRPLPAKVAATRAKNPKVRLTSGPKAGADTASESRRIDPPTARNP